MKIIKFFSILFLILMFGLSFTPKLLAIAPEITNPKSEGSVDIYGDYHPNGWDPCKDEAFIAKVKARTKPAYGAHITPDEALKMLETRCGIGGSSGGYSGGGDVRTMIMEQAIQGLFDPIFRSLGQGLAELLFGTPGGNNLTSQQQQELEQQRQQELERQQRAFQEEMDRQAEARRQAEEAWLRERDKSYSMLKGPKLPDSLELKGMKSANLDIKDIAPPSRDKRDLSTQWKRLHCATYLSEMADKASRQGKPDEASYLTEQAAQAMAGGELGVKCPDAPAPPTITQKAPGPPTPQEQFYTTLMQTTKVDLGKLQVAEKQLTEQKEKKEEVEKKVEERRQEVQRLQQAPPSSNQPQSDTNMLAEAERLLHEAEGEAAEATQALKDAQKQYQDATAALQRDNGLFEQVKKNPQAAESALTQLKK